MVDAKPVLDPFQQSTKDYLVELNKKIDALEQALETMRVTRAGLELLADDREAGIISRYAPTIRN